MPRPGALLLPIVACLGLAACAGPGPEALIGEVWRWEGQTGPAKGEWLEIPHPGRYTLAFEGDGSYAIRADCNTGSGGYTANDGTLGFGLAALTAMACGPRSLDTRFLDALKRVRGFARDDAALALRFGGGKGEMRFAAARRVGLEGTTWRVRGVHDGGQAVASVIPGSHLGATPDATFGADGRVTGSAGCNRYFASYRVEGDTLEIGPVGASRRACAEPEGVMQQEGAFLAALASAARWKVSGGRLTLRSTDGTLAVELVAAVTGTVSLPDGDSFPPGSRLSVQVLDVSLSNAPSAVIGEQVLSVSALANPPAWEVGYDPADIDVQGRYAVIARIHDADGRIVFATPESVPVLTRDEPRVGVALSLDAVR